LLLLRFTFEQFFLLDLNKLCLDSALLQINQL
jgi:hypothetical protein